MFIDERSRVADVSAARDTARLPWLAAMPTTASELVCVGKIKSNGVSQSLFIDRSEWPPKTSQHNGVPLQARPHQTRAAAVVAAAAVAAAAPKVICISPVANPQRSHTVIRRAVTPVLRHHHHHHQQQKQQNKDMMYDEQQTGGNEVPVTEMDTATAAASLSRPTSKRTFEQTQDYDSQQLRVQLRSVANAKAKAARVADVDTVDTSSTTSTVLPGSSVLLPGWASKSGADGRHQLRSLLPRDMDVPPAMNNVITIIPTTTSVLPLCKKPATSSVVIPSNVSPSLTAVPPPTPSDVASSLPDGSRTTSDECVSSTVAVTRTDSAASCLDRSFEATRSIQVECRSTKNRNEPTVSGSQLLQRIRLIECEMTSADNAPATASPFYVNVVPLKENADNRPPSQRVETVAASPNSRADVASDDDDQPPPQMLEALRLVRNPSSSRRNNIVTSSPPSDAKTPCDACPASTSHHRQVLAPASAAVSSAATRLVTMKLVNRSA